MLCDGRPVRAGTPRDALDAGVLSLSADRAAESIFARLGVRENMTVQVLDEFAAGGLISAPKERARRAFARSKSSTSSPPISISRSAGFPAAISRKRCCRAASSTRRRRC